MWRNHGRALASPPKRWKPGIACNEAQQPAPEQKADTVLAQHFLRDQPIRDQTKRQSNHQTGRHKHKHVSPTATIGIQKFPRHIANETFLMWMLHEQPPTPRKFPRAKWRYECGASLGAGGVENPLLLQRGLLRPHPELTSCLYCMIAIPLLGTMKERNGVEHHRPAGRDRRDRGPEQLADRPPGFHPSHLAEFALNLLSGTP